MNRRSFLKSIGPALVAVGLGWNTTPESRANELAILKRHAEDHALPQTQHHTEPILFVGGVAHGKIVHLKPGPLDGTEVTARLHIDDGESNFVRHLTIYTRRGPYAEMIPLEHCENPREALDAIDDACRLSMRNWRRPFIQWRCYHWKYRGILLKERA